jgi:ABC-type lipoprotein release transport system permease subunit
MTPRIALRSLFQARRRNGLLSGALIVTALLFVTLLGLARGINSALLESTVLLTSGHVNIAGFYKTRPDMAVAMVSDVARIRALIEKEVAAVRHVTDRHRAWSKLVSDGGSLFAAVNGIALEDDPELLALLQAQAKVAADRPLGAGDPGRLSEPNTAVLFASQAAKLKVGVGDTVTLTGRSVDGRMNAVDVRVVAVVRDVGPLSAWNVFVPKPVMQALFQLQENTTGVVMVYLDDIARAEAVREQLQGILSASGFEILEPEPKPFWLKLEPLLAEPWVGQRLDLSTWEGEVASAKSLIDGLAIASAFLTLVLGGLVAVGIGSAMWISVHERTAEIGTMRAIGMSRRGVLKLILCEAALLGAGATLVGGALAALLALATTALRLAAPGDAAREFLMGDIVRLEPAGGHLVAAIAVFTTTTIMASLPPAIRAARIRPAVTMQR